MSLLVRKATLGRPNRQRRAQTQRDSRGTKDSPISRRAASRSTWSDLFPLRSALARARGRDPAVSLRLASLRDRAAASPRQQGQGQGSAAPGIGNPPASDCRSGQAGVSVAPAQPRQLTSSLSPDADPERQGAGRKSPGMSGSREAASQAFSLLEQVGQLFSSSWGSMGQLAGSRESVHSRPPGGRQRADSGARDAALSSVPEGGGGGLQLLALPGGPGGGDRPLRHLSSSLRESDLSKPRSDLPFTRADLPVRHASLPPRRLDSPSSPEPPVTSSWDHQPQPHPQHPGAPVEASGRPPCRHFTLPPRYLDLPRSRLDFPLRRPDSEQAYRDLARRELIQRQIVASVCLTPQSHPPDEALALLYGEAAAHSQDLYQTSEAWRHSGVDQSQRSECLQQILEANKDADSPCDFVCRVTDILSTTVVSTVLLFLTLTVPVAMIIVGVKYMDDCPLERRIPVYLLVGGCFLALKLLGMLWKNLQLRRYDNMDAFYDSPDSDLAFTSRTFRMMDWILSAFLLAWHVVGAVWVLALWRPAFSPSLHEPSHYCGSAVYFCALGELIATAIVLVLVLIGCAALALCYKYTNVFEQ